MTGIPSKDRAEAHIDAAREIARDWFYGSPTHQETLSNSLFAAFSTCYGEGRQDGFAEGMKRAAEIANKTRSGPVEWSDDGHPIASVVVGGRAIVEAILSELREAK